MQKNSVLYNTIVTLEKAAKKAALWERVASDLSAPTRRMASVNVGKLNALDVKGVVIPGKLLAGGAISKPVTVVALSASTAAVAKITQAGGKVKTLVEEATANPTAKGLTIVR